jgi:hypothetical protein
MTHDDKRSKILERVRALLAKADGTNFSEEADAFRAKADELMTAYAIEQWQVQQAQAKTYERPKPEVRQFNFEWWGRSARSGELWQMFIDVSYHCRCVVATRGYGSGGYRTIPVIGQPSDLDYFDLLFTHLMLQMGKQLEPKPDPSMSFGENAYTLRMSGMNRLRIATLMWEAHLVPDTDTSAPLQLRNHDGKYSPAAKKVLRALRKAGEEYAAEKGLDTTKVSPGVWQRSFALGFVRTIDRRLTHIREMQQEKSTPGAPSMAIALQDIRKQAADLYDELWPRPEDDGKRRKGRGVSRNVRIYHRGVEAGREAGNKADLQGKPSRGMRQTPEIGR